MHHSKNNLADTCIHGIEFLQTFYERKPCGLSGALEDLGIVFVGRQHSGTFVICKSNRLFSTGQYRWNIVGGWGALFVNSRGKCYSVWEREEEVISGSLSCVSRY